MMDKTILIALALIGVILFFGLVSPPQQSQETATAQQGQLIDSGEFVVDQGGERVIDEQYTLFFSPAEGYMLLSQETMAVSGQKITLAQQYEFDRDFMPVLYHLAADTPSGSQIISAQMGIKGLHMETRVGTAQQQADVPGKDVMILDNNLISHYVVLLLALQDLIDLLQIDLVLFFLLPGGRRRLSGSLRGFLPEKQRTGKHQGTCQGHEENYLLHHCPPSAFAVLPESL